VDPSRLESRIVTLRAQVRRILALHGMSWVIGLVVPLIIVVGLLDWMFHLDSPVRLAALVGLAGFALWLGFRYVSSPWWCGSPTSTSRCGSRNGGPA